MMVLQILATITMLFIASTNSKEIVKFTLSSYILPDKSLKMELDVVTPRSPGPYPVIVYMTGLSGIAPAVFQ